MNTTTLLTKFLVGLVTVIVFDMLWVGIIARKFYNDTIGHLRSARVNRISAVLVWTTIVLGIMVFVITNPLVTSWKLALAYGALSGAISYAIYEFTNHATLQKRPVKVVVIDTLWGSVLCGVVALTIWSF